jgi:hypothetical protein
MMKADHVKRRTVLELIAQVQAMVDASGDPEVSTLQSGAEQASKAAARTGWQTSNGTYEHGGGSRTVASLLAIAQSGAYT